MTTTRERRHTPSAGGEPGPLAPRLPPSLLDGSQPRRFPMSLPFVTRARGGGPLRCSAAAAPAA